MSRDLSTLLKQADPVPTDDHVSEEEFRAVLAAIEKTFDEQASRRRFSFDRLWQRPALVAAVAAAITALVIAVPLLLLLLPTGERDVIDATTTSIAPTTTTATTTTTPATTTTTPAATTTAPVTTTTEPVPEAPPAPPITWTRLPEQAALENALFTGWVTKMTVGGPGLVVTGYADVADWVSAGVVFVSADGDSWDQIVLPADGAMVPTGPADVAVGQDGRIVAVGIDPPDPAVWVSDDGYTWERISADLFAEPGDQRMLAVTAGGPGFVAVGNDGDTMAVWVSPDGIEWSRVEDDDLDVEAGTGNVVDVVAGGPGLIAVGAGQGWVSVDGYEWEPLPADTFAEEARSDGWWGLELSVGPPGTTRILGIGEELWASENGYDWELTERDLSLGGPRWGSTVAWNGEVGVAIGQDRWHFGWVTGDGGATWTQIELEQPTFSEFFDTAVTVAWLEDRWVVLGQDERTNGGVVWVGTLGD